MLWQRGLREARALVTVGSLALMVSAVRGVAAAVEDTTEAAKGGGVDTSRTSSWLAALGSDEAIIALTIAMPSRDLFGEADW